jgi:hypothetical protein
MVVHGEIIRIGFGGRFAGDETAPGFVAFVDNLGRVFFVFGFARKGECVLGFAVGDLIDPGVSQSHRIIHSVSNVMPGRTSLPEPLIRRANKSRKMSLHVLNIIQLRREGVLHVDDDNFPVRLALIEERHDTKHFDLLYLPDVPDLLADLAHVQWVVVPLGFGLCVHLCGVFPRLPAQTNARACDLHVCAGKGV